MCAWQIQYYFMELDEQAWLEGRDKRELSIFERRRYYLINWQEPRLFRNQRGKTWNENVANFVPDGLTKVFKRRILNRHYQFRDPEQIKKRLALRYGNRRDFQHVKSMD